MSDYKEIWETLSQVDVSEYVEEKMNLSYLSWSRAWYLLCQKYADAKYLYHEPKKFEDGTMEVAVTITIGECKSTTINRDVLRRRLPCLDWVYHCIWVSRMTCLTKARTRSLRK